MFKSFIGASVIAIAASTASAATLHRDSNTVNAQIDLGPGVQAGTGAVYDQFAASGFNVTDTDGDLGSFTAWCIELAQTFAQDKVYNVTAAPTLAIGAFMQNLFDSSYGGVDTSDAVQVGGFQVAIWEVLNETAPSYDAEAGAFFVDGTTLAGVADKANDYLAAAGSYAGPQRYNVTYLASDESQNLVTAAPVPVPAAGVLMLAGLAGLGFAGRRRA